MDFLPTSVLGMRPEAPAGLQRSAAEPGLLTAAEFVSSILCVFRWFRSRQKRPCQSALDEGALGVELPAGTLSARGPWGCGLCGERPERRRRSWSTAERPEESPLPWGPGGDQHWLLPTTCPLRSVLGMGGGTGTWTEGDDSTSPHFTAAAGRLKPLVSAPS